MLFVFPEDSFLPSSAELVFHVVTHVSGLDLHGTYAERPSLTPNSKLCLPNTLSPNILFFPFIALGHTAIGQKKQTKTKLVSRFICLMSVPGADFKGMRSVWWHRTRFPRRAQHWV